MSKLPEKSNKATMEQVAEDAGVSLSTVSLVVNNDPRIKASTVRAVREAIAGLGYTPPPVNSRQGRHPRKRRPIRRQQVALLHAEEARLSTAPVYVRVMQGIEERLREDGWSLIVRALPHEQAWEKIPGRLDGCILFAMSDVIESRLLRELRRLDGVVRIMGRPVTNDFFDHITYAADNIGAKAAAHLLGKGHRNLVTVGSANWPRLQDFVTAARCEGVRVEKIVHENLIDESSSRQKPNLESLLEVARKIQGMSPRPTALFTYDDITVMGLYYALTKVGLVPGQDIELCGVNNDAVLLDCLHPRPATVDIHAIQIGQRAVEQLYWRLEHPREPRQVIQLETEVVTE